MKKAIKNKITLQAIMDSIEQLSAKHDLQMLDVINKIDTFSENFERKLDDGLSGLAAMVNDGFTDHSKRMDRIEGLLDRTETRLSNLELGQETIVSRLDNVAYKFEIVDLHRRVEVLERHDKQRRSRGM